MGSRPRPTRPRQVDALLLAAAVALAVGLAVLSAAADPTSVQAPQPAHAVTGDGR